jgi:hypothetical protein
MSHIAPLPREAITDPEMIELIAQSEKLGIPDDLFPRIIARAPEQAKPLMRALLQSHAQGNVDHRLKEIIRILLARFANDKYFSALRSRKAQDMGLRRPASLPAAMSMRVMPHLPRRRSGHYVMLTRCFWMRRRSMLLSTMNSKSITQNRRSWSWAPL